MARKQTRVATTVLLVAFIIAIANMSPGAAQESVVTGPLYHFTNKLFATISSSSNVDGAKPSENIIVSPISIHKALNLVLLGADANSTTQRELHETLGYANLSDAQITRVHEGYASVLSNFAKLSKMGLAMMKKDEPAEGESEENFKRRLRYGNFGPNPPVIDMFNMVITHNQAQVRPEYAAKVKQYYESSVENVDDSKRETKTKIMDRLNSWAKEAGFEQPIIKEEELGGDWEAILLSAVRVQAFWFEKFAEVEEAGKAIFYNHGLRESPVHGKRLELHEVDRARYLELTANGALAQHKQLHARMSASAAFKALSSLNVQIVQVPLEGGLSYTIFEPLEHSTSQDNKLTTLVRELSSTTSTSNGTTSSTKLAQALELLDGQEGASQRQLAHLAMPKFKFERELQLNAALQSMGVRGAFARQNAGLGGITREPLRIAEVKHQAMVDVSEVGIKAAGVTKVRMMLEAALIRPREPLRVQITRPFVFLIRYEKLPLFVGQLTSL